MNNPKVLDVEIAFGQGNGTPRMDLAALQQGDGGIEVRFYEAKQFAPKTGGKNPLRASKGPPDVVKQVARYSKLLKDHSDELVKSYHQVCFNLMNLKGIAQGLPERHKLLKRIADGSVELRINPNVWLIVFGYDVAQRADQYWPKHERKLCVALNGRLLMEGDPKDLKLCS